MRVSDYIMQFLADRQVGTVYMLAGGGAMPPLPRKPAGQRCAHEA